MVEMVHEEREDRRGALSGIESRARGIGHAKGPTAISRVGIAPPLPGDGQPS